MVEIQGEGSASGKVIYGSEAEMDSSKVWQRWKKQGIRQLKENMVEVRRVRQKGLK